MTNVRLIQQCSNLVWLNHDFLLSRTPKLLNSESRCDKKSTDYTREISVSNFELRSTDPFMLGVVG